MVVGQFGHFTSARRAFQKSLFDEERFINFLDGSGLLADSGRYGVQSDRPTLELLDDGRQNLVVHAVQSARIDVEGLQRDAGNRKIDMAFALDHGEIAHAAQQRIRNARGTA